LLSHQIQHWLNAAAATVVAVVGAFTVVAAAAVFTVAAGAFTAVVVAAFMVGADIMAAGGLLVGEVITKAEAFVVGQGLVQTERAAVRTAGPKGAAVLARAEVVLRIFVRQSTMASGIRSAVPVVPRV
jgi:hypothetical protein